MIEENYCPTCGREVREGTRTTHEIMDSINSMLGLNVWIKAKRIDMLKLEEEIKNLKTTPSVQKESFSEKEQRLSNNLDSKINSLSQIL